MFEDLPPITNTSLNAIASLPNGAIEPAHAYMLSDGVILYLAMHLVN